MVLQYGISVMSLDSYWLPFKQRVAYYKHQRSDYRIYRAISCCQTLIYRFTASVFLLYTDYLQFSVLLRMGPIETRKVNAFWCRNN